MKEIFRSLKLALIVSAGLIILFFLIAIPIERSLGKARIGRTIAVDANKLASILNQAIGRSVERVVSISSFYAASQEVEADEFKAFVMPYLSADSSVLAYEWVPRVLDSNRGVFEEAVRQAGAKDFKITERSADGALVEAPLRPEHYPVLFIEPMPGNEKALGYDLASNGVRWKVMEEAMKSGLPRATPALQLVQDQTREKSFLVFVPIYNNGTHTETQESRMQNIRGFALGIFEIHKLIQDIKQPLNESGLEISISEDVDGKQSIIYSSFSEEPMHKDFRYITPVTLAQRQWAMECRPTKVYLDSLKDSSQGRLLWVGVIAVAIFLFLLLIAWTIYTKRRSLNGDEMDLNSQRRSVFLPNLFKWMINPPIRFMNQLRYGQKFMLISFLFILPLLVTGVTLISELEDRNNFSRKEIYGIQYLDPLEKVLDRVSRARFLALRYSTGDIKARPELIYMLSAAQDAVEELGRRDRDLGAFLTTSVRYHNLVENFQFLKKSTQSETPQHFIDLSEKFFTETREFITYIGDISNLILDPDLDSYYLMDAVLLKFPELQERLRDIRILGHQTIQAGSISTEDKAEFIRLHGVINFNVRELEKGFATALKSNPSGTLKISLQKLLPDFLSTMSTLLNLSEYNLAYTPIAQVNASSYDSMVLECINAMEVLRGQSVKDLEVLLQKRIDRLERRKNRVLFFSITVVLIALYIWLAFYYGFMRVVFALENASKRMVSGGEIQETQLETKDELNRVVQSFNNMALKLRQERDQAKEGEERFRIVAENTSNLIYEWDMKTNELNWIGKIDEYLGYASGAFPRTLKGWEDVVHPEDRERVFNAIDRHMKTREPFFEEYRVVKANGEIAIWIDGGTALWAQGGGDPKMWIGAITDITEKRKLEAQLLQSQKMDAVGKLAGGVAHDLNNLLTVINGYADLTLETLATDNPLRADLEEIFKAGKRARDLTDQLLAFSRRQVVKPVPVDLNLLFANLEKMLKRLLGENIEVVMRAGEALKLTKIDPGQMEQVIMNLTLNARDAMSGRGKIIFQTENVVLSEAEVRNDPGLKPGAYVQWSVTDTGTGISEEVRRHLFEPFFTTKPKGKGTGLGLATCYGIVKQMEGYIAVRSELGKGTTFKIYLPVAEEEPATGEKGRKQQQQQQKTLPKGSGAILLVEDELMVRQLCTRVLNQHGYTLFTAQNGVEAVKLFGDLAHQRTKVDLLLTDVVMPQMGGKEAVEKIKKIQPNLKVLFMSGYIGDTLDATGILDAGFDLLKKPFSPLALLEAVHKVLANGRGGL